MDLEDFLDFCNEIKSASRRSKFSEPGINTEIQMWRNLYLENLIPEQNPMKVNFIWHVFLSTPCKEMVKYGPEKIIEDARNGYDENERRIPPPSTA